MDGKRSQLTPGQLLVIAKKLIEAQVFQVTLTGGEPFSVECLPNLIEEFLSHGIIPYITSNGSYIGNDIGRWLGSRNVPVQISLDSHIPGRHDHIRGAQGAFQVAVKAIEILLENGVKTSLSFCANRLNYLDIEGVVLLAINMGIERVLIGEVVPVFEGGSVGNDLLFRDKEYRDFIATACSVRRQYCSKVDMQISTEWGFLYHNGVEHTPCTALDRDMAVLFSGDGSPCPFIRNGPYLLGNILDQDLHYLWRSQAARSFRRGKSIGCSEMCTHYSVCKSGCKAIPANSGDPINRRDPRCPL